MDLDSQHLTLIDPQDLSVLNVQAIQSIRVWGVGRDNGRSVSANVLYKMLFSLNKTYILLYKY